jgi:hypothetical protein
MQFLSAAPEVAEPILDLFLSINVGPCTGAESVNAVVHSHVPIQFFAG